MATLYSGLQTALQAMQSHQLAIQVIEHNIANANTPGYRRQEAVLAAGLAYPSPRIEGGTIPGQLGTGVVVDQIRRFNTNFLDVRYRRELAESQRWDLESSVLREVETLLAETSSDGLIPKLDAFWSGWQLLSSDPSNGALRLDLQTRAVALTDALNLRAEMLLRMEKDQDLAITQRVDEINQVASQIANLNVEIGTIQAAGDAPNDLLDKRDLLLDRLSAISGAAVSFQDNGEALVSIGGHVLVVGSTAFALAAEPNGPGNTLEIAWVEDQRPLLVQSGELAGLMDARDRVIPAQMQALNDIAYELARQVNAIHAVGIDPSSPTGVNFFTDINGFATTNYALEIRVSDAVLSDVNNIVAGDPALDADGRTAQAIADLRQAGVMAGSATINQYYTRFIGELGLAVKSAAARADDRAVVANSLATLRESTSGVSLDEEAVELIKYQRAYQAAARLMTAIDEMLDRVINGMGIVGR